jgi:hypothetical protein
MIRRVAVLAAAVCLLAGCRWDGSDGRDHNPMNQPAYALPSPVLPDHAVRGPAFSGDQASFELVDGADAVRVVVADLGGAMLEMSTPEPAKAAPVVDVEGPRVIAGLRGTGLPGPAVVTVTLSRDVRWTVRLSGGATDELVDLTGGPGGDIDFVAGTSRAEAALPAAPGTQRITMSGGTNQFVIRLAGDAPVRVAATGGAASVTIDGVRHTGIPADAIWTPDAWATATSRYDINATAGVSTMTVTHN